MNLISVPVWLNVTLTNIGAVGSGVHIVVMYVITAELFPTVVRGIAVGIGSLVGRIGVAIVPYLILLVGFILVLYNFGFRCQYVKD